MLKYSWRLKPSARRLRTAMTDAEQRLWAHLRRKQVLGVQFYRQKPIGTYVVDFYAPAVALVVEVDGAHHYEVPQATRDELRTTYLRAHGLRVLRFGDREVLQHTEAVVESIFAAVARARESPYPPLPTGGDSASG